ncbi:hypothetical protein H696_02425 [Fonticula alba]|uniref:PhoPQ-activated pathogenicity-related protein n=1 Tax=Fonticula alba TaxID=691883 RepID=A0A058ZAQ8_FONAL|nr:hypothetical protein H696_02425 [Fonticula alba]KCV71479.1 hypothetical protein H696_02425 [Fonticula alba]|eukprot:XP_009494602.1 hypothetical protein H696_02425 [Fonticula alba]
MSGRTNWSRLVITLAALLGCLFWAAPRPGTALPLDDYLNNGDTTYNWEVASVIPHASLGYSLYMLKLTSQTWLNSNITDTPVWEHWLRVAVPKNIKTDLAALYIGGGRNPLGNPPEDMEAFLPPIAVENGMIVAELSQVPNQPIIFADEDFGRSEDSFLAKTWKIFMRTNEPYIVGRFPMVKAAVRAMDAIQEFAAQRVPTAPSVERFAVVGASKRGWVSWLTGAVDSRVVASAPIVIDVLDMFNNFNNIYQTYGRWPLALNDYTEANITQCLNCPAFERLADVEDPLVYIERYKERGVPVFAINAVSDEFFVPDGWKFWYPFYDGEKYLAYLPNTEHSLVGHVRQVTETLSSLMHLLIYGGERPVYDWSLDPSGQQIVFRSETRPVSVKLYQAHNKKDRSFILNCYLKCKWVPTDLTPVDPEQKVWVANVELPETGYRGFFVQAEYDVTDATSLVPRHQEVTGAGPAGIVAGTTLPGSDERIFTVTTGVSIVPLEMPHPPCGVECDDCAACSPNGEFADWEFFTDPAPVF